MNSFKAALPLVGVVLWLVWVMALLVFRRRPELRVGTAREFICPVAALAIGLAWFFSTPTSPGTWFLALYMRAAVITGVRRVSTEASATTSRLPCGSRTPNVSTRVPQ